MIIDATRPYYQVGPDIFFSKLEALIKATKTNIHPTWHFTDHVWSAMDWTRDYNYDLQELYYRRARQLREKYDYIIISYSGGSDSRTVLDSFLKQGLHVDEILHAWPRKATENIYSISNEPDNFLSEYDLVLKPDLEYIAKNHPEIKITFNDFSDQLLGEDAEISDNDWFLVNDYMTPNVFRKYTSLTDEETTMLETGKKTACIWGVEKPQITYRDGKLFFYFLDKSANTRSVDAVNNRTSEFFFWTPDMPELVQQQARAVYHHFKSFPQDLYLVDWDKRKKPKTKNNKRILTDILRRVVYPDWHPDRFQADKPTNMVWQETDRWFFTHHQDTRYFKSWKWGIDHVQKSVDQKYQEHSPENGRFEGWVGFINNFYNLGEL